MDGSIVIDHILTYTTFSDIEKCLERYKKAGFIISEETVRHKLGKRNGFIYFGPTYLEFLWIEDKKKFDSKANKVEKAFSQNPRPFGIGIESKDVSSFHKERAKEGFKLKNVTSRAPRGGQKKDPWWSFQSIPRKYLPGCWTFILTYLKKDWDKIKLLKIGENTIYGISGVTFVSSRPKLKALKWLNFFGLSSNALKGEDQFKSCQFNLGEHVLEWISDKNYFKKYGLVQSPKISNAPKRIQDIALVHLLARDLKKAVSVLSNNDFLIVKDQKNGLFVKPDPRDGFAFLIKERAVDEWLKDHPNFVLN